MKKMKKNKTTDGYEDTFDGLELKHLIRVKDDFLPSPATIARSLKKAKLTVVFHKNSPRSAERGRNKGAKFLRPPENDRVRRAA